jgi:replicative DNA helicase
VSDRPLPQNLEAERAVLGAVLVDNDRFDDAAAILDASMWYREAHRQVWIAMSAIRDRKIGLDLVTLREHLTNSGKIDDVGGAAYVASLVDGVPRSTNVEYYASIVRDKAQLRRLIRVSTENIEAGFTAEDSADEVIDLALARLASVGELAQQVEFESSYDWMTRTANAVIKRLEDPRDVTGVESGVIQLDRHTRGFQPGALYYIGARPGVGKSALALQIGLHAAKTGVSVMYTSLEMSKEELGLRAVAIEAQVDAFRLATGRISSYEQQRAAAAWDRISGLPFFIADAHNLTAPRIRALTRRMHTRQGIRLAIVDYMQLLKDSEKHFSRNAELEAISRGFKTLSLDLGIPMLVLSQLSRPPKEHKGPPPRPRLTDLRDSGALEQDADAVLLLHRTPFKDDADSDVEDAEILIAKQRSGPVGLVKMHFIGPITYWKERSIPAAEEQVPLPDAAPWEQP